MERLPQSYLAERADFFINVVNRLTGPPIAGFRSSTSPIEILQQSLRKPLGLIVTAALNLSPSHGEIDLRGECFDNYFRT
jgi:hypothetical protein